MVAAWTHSAVTEATERTGVRPACARFETETFSFIPWAPLYNVTGQPSMSVPLHWNREGLPVGAMFSGRYGDEATLFRLAARLEEARPWKDRKPGVCG